MIERQLGPDPYVTLGVPRDATHVEIGRAYRALVCRHHPDVRAATDAAQAATDPARLRQTLAAYTVLGNPGRRADYDLRNPPPPPPTEAPPGPARPDPIRDQPLLRAGPVLWQPSPSARRPRTHPTST